MFSTDLKELYIRSGGNCYRLLNAADDLWTPKQGVHNHEECYQSSSRSLARYSLPVGRTGRFRQPADLVPALRDGHAPYKPGGTLVDGCPVLGRHAVLIDKPPHTVIGKSSADTNDSAEFFLTAAQTR